MRSSILILSFSLALIALSPKPLFASDVRDAKNKYAESLEKWVAELELQIKQLVKLEKLGNVAEGERDFNEAQLAAIRFELARIIGDPANARPHLQEFVDIEQRRLERLKPLRKLNAVPLITMTHVRSGLHFGKFHMAKLKKEAAQVVEQLEEFVSLSEQEVDCFQNAVEAESVSPCEVSVANHQLLFARYLLGKRQGNFDEILPEIRAINQRLETDWLAAEKLHQRRLITMLDSYIMHLYYLESELLIAAIEDDRETMAKLLEQRITLHDRVLKKGREIGWGPTVAINFQINLENLLSCSSAFDQFLLARLSATGQFEYESMLLFGL